MQVVKLYTAMHYHWTTGEPTHTPLCSSRSLSSLQRYLESQGYIKRRGQQSYVNNDEQATVDVEESELVL